MEKLRLAQLEMLSILCEIDRICQKYNLHYWLFAGTLLGAVRHMGFIPWDDDCDIAMMREDYEKFISVLQLELPSHLFLQNKETDPHYPRKIVKIRSNRIKLIEKDEEFNEPYNQGVFVDIFIHDYYPSYSVPVLKYFQRYLDNKHRKFKFSSDSFERRLFNVCLVPQSLFFYISRAIFSIVWKCFRKKTSQYVGISFDYADYKAVYHAEDILPVKTKIEFEKFSFSVPRNPDALLRQCYGDYRRWPNENERHWHAKDIIVTDDRG